MPQLQFDLTDAADRETKLVLADWATERYADVMEMGTGHVAVAIRERDDGALGRVPADGDVGLLNADVRAGRSAEQRRTFATAVIERLEAVFGIPAEHCYVVYTEHAGEDFVLSKGPLGSWDASEATDGAGSTGRRGR